MTVGRTTVRKVGLLATGSLLGLSGCCSLFGIYCPPKDIADLVTNIGYNYSKPQSKLCEPVDAHDVDGVGIWCGGW
jgi:hypothetical protein